jgi:hypothetical protein
MPSGGEVSKLNHRKRLSLLNGYRPAYTRSMATDLLKTKIDDWELSTGDFEESVLSSAGIARSLSDTGPRRKMDSTTFDAKAVETAKVCPVIQIGRPSDDVFGIEADGFVGERAVALTKKISQKEIAEWI